MMMSGVHSLTSYGHFFMQLMVYSVKPNYSPSVIFIYHNNNMSYENEIKHHKKRPL